MARYDGKTRAAIIGAAAATGFMGVGAYYYIRNAYAQPPTRPPPSGDVTGLYVPVYDEQMRPPTVTANRQLVGFPNIFTLNPNSGPVPLGERPTIESFAATVLQDNPSCFRLGYIATGWGNQQNTDRKSVAGIMAQVDMWYTWRQAGLVDGISWDEQSDNNAMIPFYQQITNYARSLGFFPIRGNPGKDTTRQYVELNDFTSVFEGIANPTESMIQQRTFWPDYPKHKFNLLVDGRASIDASFVNMVMQYFGTIFITDIQGDPIRYQIPPSYYDQLVQLIGAQV